MDATRLVTVVLPLVPVTATRVGRLPPFPSNRPAFQALPAKLQFRIDGNPGVGRQLVHPVADRDARAGHDQTAALEHAAQLVVVGAPDEVGTDRGRLLAPLVGGIVLHDNHLVTTSAQVPGDCQARHPKADHDNRPDTGPDTGSDSGSGSGSGQGGADGPLLGPTHPVPPWAMKSV